MIRLNDKDHIYIGHLKKISLKNKLSVTDRIGASNIMELKQSSIKLPYRIRLST